jgi:hypothetical protein
MPAVLDLGGPVLAHPRVVPVFYEGDALMTQLVLFLGKLTTATYWSGATSEYGVGPLTVTAPVVIPGTPPATLTGGQLAKLITKQLDDAIADGGADAGAWPAPDANTIYAIFLAAGTTETLGTAASCSYFAGYHLHVSYGAGDTAIYAVMPRCSSFPLLPGASALDIATVAASHELAEAVTDPVGSTYASVDFYGTGWREDSVGSEIGDMCILEPSSFYTPADVGFMVQRVWSNANAAAGHDPCAPVPAGEVYFTALPELSMVEMTPGNYLAGVTVAPGASATVPLHLFSDAKTEGPWTVAVTEAGEDGTSLPPDPLDQLSFSLDHATGVNGDVVTLTIRRKPLAGGEAASGLGFRVTSTLGAESRSYWGIAGY